MARKRRTNPDFLNGVPELLMLRLLSREPMYGYQLVQSIKATSGNQLEFGEGSIYPILHRLEADGCLTSREQAANGRSRVVYRTTKKGEKRLAESTRSWEQVSQAIRAVLDGKQSAVG